MSSTPPSSPQRPPLSPSRGGPLEGHLDDIHLDDYTWKTRLGPDELDLVCSTFSSLGEHGMDGILHVSPKSDLEEIETVVGPDHPRFLAQVHGYLRNKRLIDFVRSAFKEAYSVGTPRAIRGIVKFPMRELVDTLNGEEDSNEAMPLIARKVSLYRFTNLILFRFETCLRLKAGRNPFPVAAKGDTKGGEIVLSVREFCVQSGIVAVFVAIISLLIYACYKLWLGITSSKYDPLLFR